MRSFLRALFRRRQQPFRPRDESQRPKISASHQSVTMAGGVTAAALYACTVTSPIALGPVPEDSEAKAHHLKGGKGFTNPWDSWRELTGPEIGKTMLW